MAPEIVASIGRNVSVYPLDRGDVNACLLAGHEAGKKANAQVAEVVREALASGRVADGPKGWVLTALSRAVALFYNRPRGCDVAEVLRDCVRQGGDTNAAIAGAVAGAASGDFSSPLLDAVLSCDTLNGTLVRPAQYRAGRLSLLATGLAGLWQP